jgi:FkbM family methyltransferase
MMIAKTIRKMVIWYSGVEGFPDRLRLLYCWLSAYLGTSPGPPVPVRTRVMPGYPIYLRPASPDFLVLWAIFWNRVYELPVELTGEVSSVLDLGAYTGISVLYFARRYSTARIVAVEPDTDNYACLQRNIQKLARPDQVETLKACVYSQHGTVRFTDHGPSWARSILGAGGVEVSALTVLELLERFEARRVDLLKMDIEGGEKYVFESLDQWIDRVGWILLEVHYHAMTLPTVVEAVHRWGRKVYYREPWPSWKWVEVNQESWPAIESNNESSLDLVIPPSGAKLPCGVRT